MSNIQPTKERVDTTRRSTTLRKHLKDDAELTYPVESSFLSGSYARHTAVDPIKDAHIIFVLEEKTVAEDRKSPSPREILEDIRSIIDEFYDEVNLETQRRSIQVYLEEDDISIDIVPSIAPDGKDDPLHVPDYEQAEWIDSHPSEHIRFATETNKDSNGHFVRVAKSMKWWKLEQLDKERAPKSFLLEMIVMRNVEKNASGLCKSFLKILRKISLMPMRKTATTGLFRVL